MTTGHISDNPMETGRIAGLEIIRSLQVSNRKYPEIPKEINCNLQGDDLIEDIAYTKVYRR
jgi:hypothetical protein